MVKASTNTRRTLKSWLKDQKTKAEKPAPATSTADTPRDDVAQQVSEASQDTKLNGESGEAAGQYEEAVSLAVPTEEQPLPSIEVGQSLVLVENY